MKIKKYLKIFFLFSKNAFKTVLQSRPGLFLFILGKVIRFFFLFGIIFLIFSKTKAIKGWSLNEVIICYLTFNFLDTLTQALFREVYRFRPLVISGNLDLILIKPYPPFLRILVGGVDFLDFFLLLPYFLLLIYFVSRQPETNLFSVFLYFLLLINSFLIILGFHIIVLSLAILTSEIDNAIMIYREILNTGRFPVDIYQSPLDFFLTFFLPVGIMITFPVKALVGKLTLKFFIISFIFSISFLFFSKKLWQKALKHYQSASS